jgi:hypothetical protein
MTMTVHAVRDLPAPPEAVYAAFTDAGTIRRWWGPDRLPHVVTFEPDGGGGTRLTVTEYGYTGTAARDLSQGGLDQRLDKLERVLVSR